MPGHGMQSDLVRDSQLETRFHDGFTQHFLYKNGTSARERRVQIEERWTRLKRVGKGAYGVVYLEECQTERPQNFRAVKKIKKSVLPGQELDYSRELEAVAKFSHSNYAHCFVRSDGWFENETSIFIAMEYFKHGDLQSYLAKPLPESEAAQITSQILEGLTFMHDHGFVHRDLKPGNIMVVAEGPRWWVKITDFGTSKRRQQDVTMSHTFHRGTFAYAAPEAIGFVSNESCTFPVDMWSLGAVAYRILTGAVAFKSLGELWGYIQGYPESLNQKVAQIGASEEARDFVLRLMSPSPASRLTAEGACSHSWMTFTFTCHPTDSISSASQTELLVSDGETPKPAATHDRNTNRNSGSRTTDYQKPSVTDYAEDTNRLPKLPFDSRFIMETNSIELPKIDPITDEQAPDKGTHIDGNNDSDDTAGRQDATRMESLGPAASDAELSCRSTKDDSELLPVDEDLNDDSVPSEAPQLEQPIECNGCPQTFYAFAAAPISHLACGHWMCNKCLVNRLTLSLVSPKHMPPKCCGDPKGEMFKFSSTRIILSHEINHLWQRLRLVHEAVENRTFRCPMGFKPSDNSLLVTTDDTPVWYDQIQCSGCIVSVDRSIDEQSEDRERPRRAWHCLFCDETDGKCSCLNDFNSIVCSFVQGLKARGILEDQVIKQIDSAMAQNTEILAGHRIRCRLFPNEREHSEPPMNRSVSPCYGLGHDAQFQSADPASQFREDSGEFGTSQTPRRYSDGYSTNYNPAINLEANSPSPSRNYRPRRPRRGSSVLDTQPRGRDMNDSPRRRVNHRRMSSPDRRASFREHEPEDDQLYDLGPGPAEPLQRTHLADRSPPRYSYQYFGDGFDDYSRPRRYRDPHYNPSASRSRSRPSPDFYYGYDSEEGSRPRRWSSTQRHHYFAPDEFVARSRRRRHRNSN